MDQKNEQEQKLTKSTKEIIVGDTIKAIFDRLGRQHGIIHKSAPVIINGDKGFLIWDYILYNELTFVNGTTDKIITLFKSLSDKKMEEKFNEYIEKYGS
ncbi:hypothetical protein [Paenibacillus sp. URB8-2]|uniref:hypothetical protein n=1 Tax=Paenibacillus sp. URB8-2 TaxID=2741301 RepID=UPI0015C025C2|nr:hypothetical protein [Paenibacillus sp. URB8-2]BCG59717.1 hypothetical protein PUR_31420 [Paenibacillus sp. URB8-2]